jgi:hypothetical protein
MQDKDHKHPPADLLKEWSFEVNGAHNTNWFDRASRLTAVWIAAPFLAEPAKRTGGWHVMERFMVPMMDRHLSSVQKRCRARLHNKYSAGQRLRMGGRTPGRQRVFRQSIATRTLSRGRWNLGQSCCAGADRRPLGALRMKIVSTPSEQAIWGYTCCRFRSQKGNSALSRIKPKETYKSVSYWTGFKE